jgi:hypothetical protein
VRSAWIRFGASSYSIFCLDLPERRWTALAANRYIFRAIATIPCKNLDTGILLCPANGLRSQKTALLQDRTRPTVTASFSFSGDTSQG